MSFIFEKYNSKGKKKVFVKFLRAYKEILDYILKKKKIKQAINWLCKIVWKIPRQSSEWQRIEENERVVVEVKRPFPQYAKNKKKAFTISVECGQYNGGHRQKIKNFVRASDKKGVEKKNDNKKKVWL